MDQPGRFDLTLVATFALLLILAAILRRLPGFTRSTRARRAIGRWLLPLTELGVAGTGVFWVFGVLTREQSTARLATTLALLAGLAWAFRSVLQDFASGIVLRMDGVLEPDADITAGDVAGHVRQIGYRSVAIETDDGRRVAVPFSLVAARKVERAADRKGARAHTFRIEVARTLPLDRVLAELPGRAMLSPWSSTARLPDVQLLSESDSAWVLEVTTWAIDPAFASQIETTVRSEMARLGF
jgi:small-conductance mechanosensitive channel